MGYSGLKIVNHESTFNVFLYIPAVGRAVFLRNEMSGYYIDENFTDTDFVSYF